MGQQKIPALKIMGAAFANSGTIFKHIFITFWPVLIIGAFACYFTWVSYTTTDHTGSTPISGLVAAILFFVLLLSFIPTSICWTEYVITRQPVNFNFDSRIFSSLGYGILILAFLYIPIMLASFGIFALGQEAGMGTGLGVTLIIGFVLYWVSLTMRFCLVLPAISVKNQKTRMGRSWSLTKGYQIKLTLLLILPNMLVSIPTNVIEQSMGTLIYDQFSFMVVTGIFVILTIYGFLLFSEIVGRVFVFFHAPQKIDEYL